VNVHFLPLKLERLTQKLLIIRSKLKIVSVPVTNGQDMVYNTEGSFAQPNGLSNGNLSISLMYMNSKGRVAVKGTPTLK